MKKIIFLTYDYGKMGVGMFIKNLSAGLDPKKYKCYYVVSSGEDRRNKNVYPIKKSHINKIENIIEEGDLIHICAHNYEHLKILWKAYKNKKKIICSYHTDFRDNTSLKKWIELFFKKILILNFCEFVCDKNIFLTKKQKEDLERFIIFKKNDSYVIPNFIENKNILLNKKIPTKKEVLFVGRYTKIKGFEDLMTVARKLKNIHFSLIGNDYFKPKVVNVKNIGKIDNSKIFKQYDQHSILLLPSYAETWGLVILEAMARGLVVIASDLPAISEYFINNRNGYLVPPGDVERMKERILYLKNNPGEIKRISKNNLKDIWKFTAERQVPKYIKIYEEVLKKKNFKVL